MVAVKLTDYLKRHPEIKSKLSKNGTRRFISTDKNIFNAHASDFFGDPIIAEHLSIT
jgi:glutamate racemase